MPNKSKLRVYVRTVVLVLVVGFVTYCIIGMVVGGIAYWGPRYWEGPGTKYAITENQVVQAEFGFDLPPSASDVRLAIHGGKDYGLSGWMLVDSTELEVVLADAGYESYVPRPIPDWPTLYPQMTWFDLRDSEVHAGYRHPDDHGSVIISTRRVSDGRAEVFFQQGSGKRPLATWQYFE